MVPPASTPKHPTEAYESLPAIRFTSSARIRFANELPRQPTKIVEQARRNRDEFVWTAISSPEDLRSVRIAAMEDFLADYDAGLSEGRYIAASLPTLPFADSSLDRAVCSHFLFLYSEQLGASFHEDAILELCGVAEEVRIFPILALGGLPSPHVESTMDKLKASKYGVAIERVPYEFQRGGNEMMRIWRARGEEDSFSVSNEQLSPR
jgi:hypothetical protein